MILVILLAITIQITVYVFRKQIADYFNITDIPDNLTKKHLKPTPLVGGIGLIFIPIFYFTFEIYKNNIDREIVAILFIFIFLFIVGLLDDKYSFKGQNKLISVFIISLIFFLLTHHHFKIEFMNLYILNRKIELLDFWYFALPFSFSVMIFSLNIADGKNGLVVSYSIILLSLLLVFYSNIELQEYLYYFLIGLFVIFFFNIKGYLFLGTAGVNIIATSIFIILLKIYKHNNLYFEELILIYYIHIYEVIRLIIVRIKINRNPFKRDSNHIHDLIFKKNNILVSLIIYNLLSFTPFLIYKLTFINLTYSIFISVLLYYFSIYLIDKLNR